MIHEMDNDENSTSLLEDAPASKEVYLWKDIWWIKFALFGTTILTWYWVYKIVVYIFERCVGVEPAQYTNYLVDESVKMKAAEKLKEIEKDSPEEMNKVWEGHDAFMQMKYLRRYSQTKESLMFPADSDEKKAFHELIHHGIHYYDDNMSSSGSRLRRPRMHSTVAESTLIPSIMRQNKTPPIPVPAFPSMNSGSPTSCSNSCPSLKNEEIDEETVKPPPVPPRLKINKDAEVIVEKKDSSVNTDWTGALVAPAHAPHPVAVKCLTLHLYPANENDYESQLEIFMRRQNISFQVVHDCHGPNGPWISDNGKKIEGISNCLNYLEGKSYDQCHNKNLVCSLCKSKIQCCCQCKECQMYACPGNDLRGGGECQEMNFQTEDMYIDDNFEDMDRLSLTSEVSNKLRDFSIQEMK